jgi:hypothetical protein
MKRANASKLHRKSGVRRGEPGAPVLFLLGFCEDTHFAGTTECVRLGRKSRASFVAAEMCELSELCELSPGTGWNLSA